MIPLPAEVKECLQKSIRLTSYVLIKLIDLLYKRLILHADKEICCSFKSFAGRTFGYSYREDRRCISQVVPLRSCKKDISSYLRRSRNRSWSYFVASRHLWDTERYRWFYNEWVASNWILVFTHRFLGSPQGKHCNSLEGNVRRKVVPTSR